jgi:DNA polymerase (family 10)
MDKKEVARILTEIAGLLELKGENPFKSRAYVNAARAIESLEGDLEEHVREARLLEVENIGAKIAEKINELVTSGHLLYYESLKAETPPGLIEMIRIPGFGPKRAKAVYDALGIQTVGELEYACHENRLADLKGFGAKSQENILQGIAFLKQFRGRHLLSEADARAETVIAALRQVPEVARLSVAGSLRRRRETIKDIDIVVSSADPGPVMNAFTGFAGVDTILASGPTKSSVRLQGGIQVDLRVVNDSEFPFALLYFTGSKQHNIAMRARALRKGLKLNEYGLFDGDIALPCATEEAIFQRLGLIGIPPELREDLGEIEAAERGELPRLVEAGDLKGILHNHSTWSDGKNSIEQMARAAEDAGYRYIGLSDHSQTAAYAGGLTVEEIRDQQEEIDGLNARLSGIRILKGIESDILPDGSLDYPDEVLASFDFVIASIHSGLGINEEEMTRRIVKAVENPYTTILGHPTGRLLLAREGYPVDLDQVLEACIKRGVAIEVNANPHRLDIDWQQCRRAHESGCRVAINPDAHAVDGIADVVFGIGTARRGWIEAREVLNALSLEEIEAERQARL